jgi:uncharacterized membrane protein YkoI
MPMRIKSKTVAVAAAVAALGAGGAGIAYAVGDDSEEQLSGPAAERAKSAALDAVGGGTVTEVERADDGNGAYEVEVKRADGSQVEVAIDEGFQALGTTADEDASEDDDD